MACLESVKAYAIPPYDGSFTYASIYAGGWQGGAEKKCPGGGQFGGQRGLARPASPALLPYRPRACLSLPGHSGSAPARFTPRMVCSTAGLAGERLRWRSDCGGFAADPPSHASGQREVSAPPQLYGLQLFSTSAGQSHRPLDQAEQPTTRGLPVRAIVQRRRAAAPRGPISDLTSQISGPGPTLPRGNAGTVPVLLHSLFRVNESAWHHLVRWFASI
jgi:hypothetical protein